MGELNITSVDKVDNVAQILGLIPNEDIETDIVAQLGVPYDN